MARIRTIKPGFWKDEDLSALPADTHMLAAALLNYSDDEGYFNANPALVRAECCPLRESSVSIQESLKLLHGIGYIHLGTAESGKRYGRVVRFSEHQKVNRPTPSKIKQMRIAWEDSPSSHGAFTEPSPPEGKGREKEGKGKEVPSEPCRAEPDGAVDRIFEHWRTTHGHPRAVLDDKRRRLIRERLKAYTEVDLCQAITGYLNSPHHMGQNDRDTKYDAIELLLKDAKHVDMGLKFYREPPRTGLSEKSRRIIDATENWVPPEMRRAAN